MRRGDLVLFTGAGFSTRASGLSGQPIPSVDELKNALWEIAYPGETGLDDATLADVYDAAARRSQSRVGTLLRRLLRVDPASIDAAYNIWFSVPWYRAYTLNIDDLDEASARRFTFKRPIRSVSALEGSMPVTGDLLSVHLNGRVADYPHVTLSQRDYGERTARPDPWYQHLVSDMTARPVVFVGTQLNEPPLWHHLELRRSRGTAPRELRPGSYLVTPHLSKPRQELLEDLNVDWIAMTQEEFANSVLRDMSEAMAEGHNRLIEKGARLTLPQLVSVGEARASADPLDPADFMMGREPTWRDLTDGYAVTRSFEVELEKTINETTPRVVILSGTAGSGKSTTLMALGLTADALGKKVSWLGPDAHLSPLELRRVVAGDTPEILVLDDADRYGQSAAALLLELAQEHPDMVTYVSVRATKVEGLYLAETLAGISYLELAIPHLEDRDITDMLAALARANRLGRLKGLAEGERVRIFQHECGRQLLVALIQATSGERFDEKVDRECRELGSEYALIYATIAVATNLRYAIPKDTLLLATGEPTNQSLNRIERLTRQRLVLNIGLGLKLRHRVIADRVVNHYQAEGQLGEPLRGLAFALASKQASSGQKRGQEQHVLRTIMNHEYLWRMLRPAEARRIYEEIESLLSWDYHYWLQRGSYEVQHGNLSNAQNFLEQAHSLAPNDAMVQTEWAHMLLKRAATEPAAEGASERVEEALTELEAAIETRGKFDSYPYHVMGSQGLSWVHRASLPYDKRVRLLDRLKSVVDEGVQIHSRQKSLVKLKQDLDKEVLLIASAADARRLSQKERVGRTDRKGGSRQKIS